MTWSSISAPRAIWNDGATGRKGASPALVVRGSCQGDGRRGLPAPAVHAADLRVTDPCTLAGSTPPPALPACSPAHPTALPPRSGRVPRSPRACLLKPVYHPRKKTGPRRLVGASYGRRHCAGCRRGSAPGLGCGSAGKRWSSSAPPPELAALLAHLARGPPTGSPPPRRPLPDQPALVGPLAGGAGRTRRPSLSCCVRIPPCDWLVQRRVPSGVTDLTVAPRCIGYAGLSRSNTG